jgi:hypothetical protein
MKTYWRNAGIAPRITDGIRWGWVVRFTPWPLYPRGMNPLYPLYKKAGGPQSRHGRGGEQKNLIVAPARNWTLVVQPERNKIVCLVPRNTFSTSLLGFTKHMRVACLPMALEFCSLTTHRWFLLNTVLRQSRRYVDGEVRRCGNASRYPYNRYRYPPPRPRSSARPCIKTHF